MMMLLTMAVMVAVMAIAASVKMTFDLESGK